MAWFQPAVLDLMQNFPFYSVLAGEKPCLSTVVVVGHGGPSRQAKLAIHNHKQQQCWHCVWVLLLRGVRSEG